MFCVKSKRFRIGGMLEMLSVKEVCPAADQNKVLKEAFFIEGPKDRQEKISLGGHGAYFELRANSWRSGS
jgi:hypothetical protein